MHSLRAKHRQKLGEEVGSFSAGHTEACPPLLARRPSPLSSDSTETQLSQSLRQVWEENSGSIYIKMNTRQWGGVTIHPFRAPESKTRLPQL